MTKNYDRQPPTAFQRRPQNTRDEAWIRAFLHQAQVCHTAYAWDDQPFSHPNLFWFDSEQHQVVFHGSISGRMRAGLEKNPRACLEISETGRLLPSNVAIEFAIQYRSVMVFGTVKILAQPDQARRALYGLIAKYFPGMQADRDYRGITDSELGATAVYALQIESWSGKENWKDHAEQSPHWSPLDARWLQE